MVELLGGNVHTFKARLIAKGYTLTYDIDYRETFSPIAYIRAIQIILAIAAFYDYEIWQMDVKTAFLNGHLSGDQASRSWNKRFDKEIKKIDFTQNPDEPYVYLEASGSNVTFLVLYIDDILIMGNNVTILQDVNRFQQNPVEAHRTAVKTILKYLRITKDMVLFYGENPKAKMKVTCYTDAVVDWKSAKQSTIAMSFIKAEYIAAAEASMKAVWIKKFIDGLGNIMPTNKRPIEILCDNMPAIEIANDPGL
ncbi:retrovirus-related pol polyprotein from transposon TNT 1-94 [Tanacetum coccineum]